MSDDPDAAEVVIGGKRYVLPPMTFYALRRAWPHIAKIGQMEAANREAMALSLKLQATRVADSPSPQEIAALEEAQRVALEAVDDKGAGFVAQAEEKLRVIVYALALTPDNPSFDALERVLRPEELRGIYLAFNRLLAISGLLAGELGATGLSPLAVHRSNGTGSSPSLSPQE